MEQEITIYLNTHRCFDNSVFTWCMYNYEKLKETVFKDQNLYFNDKVFNELQRVSRNDKFVKMMTCEGKFRACDKRSCGSENNCMC